MSEIDAAAAAPSPSSDAPAAAAAAFASSKGKSKGKKAPEPAEIDPNFDGQLYHIGELIYANYAEGKQWFEAKVLKVEKRQNKIYYYLHYNGWGEKYQDWRPYHNDNELHKHDEEGKRLMEEAKAKMREASKKGKAGAAASSAVASADTSNKSKKSGKRRLDDDDNVVEEVSVGSGQQGEVQLKISGNLKKQLITDWESVTRQHKLVTLPRPVTVRALLSEFEESKARQETSHQMTKEIVQGIEQYFEKAIGLVLLYRFERPQFHEQLKALEGQDKKSVSDVYGAEHLLRLFVKLPSLLAHSKLDPREAIVLGSKLNDFLKFLDKKAAAGALFQTEYEATEQDYVQRAQEEDGGAQAD